MNEVFYSSIFGELTKQVQIRIDAASELRKRLDDIAEEFDTRSKITDISDQW